MITMTDNCMFRIATVAIVLVSATESTKAFSAGVSYDFATSTEATEVVEGTSDSEVSLTEISLTGCCCDVGCDCGSRCGECAGCCSCCGPQYYAVGEFVAYHRTNSSTRRPLLEDTGFNPLLFTDDLNFDYAPGVRVRLGRTNGPCCHCDACEIEYLGIFDWDASGRLTDENNIYLPGALGFAVNGFQGADQVDVRYSSDLHSLELNCVKCCCQCCSCCRTLRWDLLCGIRYLRLGEDLTLQSNNLVAPPAVNAIYDIDVDNNLYGFQLGTRMTRWRDQRIGLEMTCKVGVYGNDARQSQYIVDDIGATPFNLRPPTGDSAGSVAFVGEFSLIPMYRLTDVWSVRAGYNLLWIEGVALAPDQLDFTDTPTSGMFIDTSGGLFAHGFSAGLEARF
jgi:hypothetical protein